jgi:uncharacterized small protein (DUF1192 family)
MATEALGHGQIASGEPDVEKRLAALEKSDQVDRLLAELKSKSNGTTA